MRAERNPIPVSGMGTAEEGDAEEMMNNEYIARRKRKREKGAQWREDVCIPLMKNSMAG